MSMPVRWTRQSGASTIELLIAMAVTGAVIGALIGIVFVTNAVVVKWQQPLSAAATRPMFEVLAVSLETDAETYAVCRVTGGEIDFGDPSCQSSPVTYVVAGSNIVRNDPTGQQVLAHRLGATPAFSKACTVQNGIAAGSIRIGNLNYGGPVPDLLVFFNEPGTAPC